MRQRRRVSKADADMQAQARRLHVGEAPKAQHLPALHPTRELDDDGSPPSRESRSHDDPDPARLSIGEGVAPVRRSSPVRR